MSENIILFPGDFNPIHHGHLLMARRAKETIGGRVIFIPSQISIWKKQSLSQKHKLKMLHLVLDSFPDFEINTFELERENEQTYTIETIRHFKKLYPHARLYLLIGSDHVNDFHRWKECEAIKDLVQIIYYPRLGYKALEKEVTRFKMQEIYGHEVDVSSSEIRDMHSANAPYQVLRYIEEHHLYRIPFLQGMMSEKRYAHSLSVAHLAYEIAIANDINSAWKLYLAGLLHDLAKDFEPEEIVERMESHHPELASFPTAIFHQFIGRDLVEEFFHISDNDILSPIMYHTTGKREMTPYEMILFCADKIEPLRGFDSKKLIAECKKDYYHGFIETLKDNRRYLKSKHESVDNNFLSHECYEYYLGHK